ncbi:MAG TPA: aspartyl-phosphate phosphatase Spo0E family protein [Bacillota bacterium]|nr:aspartyl-phosphate phosphatase Spo0E family protein [Bacillota bacterium]
MDQEEILIRINTQKLKLEKLWSERGQIDPEILGISTEIDKLVNAYYRLRR